MTTQDKLAAKFSEIEDILAEAIENGELKRGAFGSSLGTLFINNDGLLVYKIERASVLRALADARKEELSKAIAYHRDQLAHYEEEMETINRLF